MQLNLQGQEVDKRKMLWEMAMDQGPMYFWHEITFTQESECGQRGSRYWLTAARQSSRRCRCCRRRFSYFSENVLRNRRKGRVEVVVLPESGGLERVFSTFFPLSPLLNTRPTTFSFPSPWSRHTICFHSHQGTRTRSELDQRLLRLPPSILVSVHRGGSQDPEFPEIG